MVWFGIAGAAFGLIGGMGMGGGIILIPVLTLFLGVSQHAAQGLNLMAFLPMSAFALINHIKNKRIDFKSALIMAGCGLAGALLGAYLASITDTDILKKCFGGFLVLLGILRIVKSIKKSRSSKRT